MHLKKKIPCFDNRTGFNNLDYTSFSIFSSIAPNSFNILLEIIGSLNKPFHYSTDQLGVVTKLIHC